MRVLLLKKQQTTYVGDSIECIFDGTQFQVYFKGNLFKSYDAKIGDTFFVYSSGKSKTPRVKKSEIKDRGERIAKALSFASAEQYAYSEDEFMTKTSLLKQSENVKNPHRIRKEGVFAFFIADVIHHSEQAKSRGIPAKVKLSNPVLAWINPEIKLEDLEELIGIYNEFRELDCPPEFIMAQ